MDQDLTPFEALARRIDSRSTLRRIWELQGGVSAQVTAFEIEGTDGRAERLVVRRHGAAELRRNPRIAADEFRLLQLLEAVGVPAPRPRFLDEGVGTFATPCLVVDYVEGESPSAAVEESELVDQLATVLAEIYRIENVSFLPQRSIDADLPPGSPEEQRIRDVLESALPLPERNPPVLLHGDFWPGNTLWRDGRLVSIIDWEDAAIGDPLADVANGRLELMWALGAEAMDDFTRRYVEHAASVDLTDLPYWDLWADLRLAGRIAEWGLDVASEKEMRAGHEAFVEQALANL
jgi:aminoglycoside phosphotransferase (APT) family kinase protein